MSKNKDLKFLHEVTGEPYAVCRRKMKDESFSLGSLQGFRISLF